MNLIGVLYCSIALLLYLHSPRYNTDHKHDIVSLALHPSGTMVATGERGPRPEIVVWDIATMKRRRVIRGFHRHAVTLLDFNETGRWLLSVGADPYDLEIHYNIQCVARNMYTEN